MKASYAHYTLHFRQPAGTSRGVLTDKETYFLKLEDEDMPGVFGLGECAVFRGLSADDVPAYEDKLRELCANISADKETDLHEFPSIRFGLETAINDFANGCRRQPFPSDFTEGMSAIPINGLVWMGTVEWCETMMKRSPFAIRMVKRCLNAELDGQRGLMELAGDATLMYYLMDEAQEGKNAFLEKRDPDFEQFPKFPG